MRNSRTTLASLIAAAAIASMGAGVAMPNTRTVAVRTPTRRYRGMTEEQRLHNTAIDAKRAEKKARKGGR